MEIKDILSIVAMVSSPIIAVGVTLWYQNRKEKRDIKRELFFNLMGHRNKLVLTEQFVDSLNMIDVVFYKDDKVLKAWRKYFDSLNQIEPPLNMQSLLVELLDEMAKTLNLNTLTQTQIQNFYIPKAHGYYLDYENQLKQELLRVLQNITSVSVVEKNEVKKK